MDRTRRYVGFMKPSKTGIGMAMLMKVERENSIAYVIINGADRYIQINLATLTTMVNISWPT